jgi:hypothetical protein
VSHTIIIDQRNLIIAHKPVMGQSLVFEVSRRWPAHSGGEAEV